MKIIIKPSGSGRLVEIDVTADLPVDVLKQLIEADLGIATDQQKLFLNTLQRPLENDEALLADEGIGEGSVILVSVPASPHPPGPSADISALLQNFDFSRIQIPSRPLPTPIHPLLKPEALLAMRANSEILDRLAPHFPSDLLAAVRQGDIRAISAAAAAEQQKMTRAQGNPESAESQVVIERWARIENEMRKVEEEFRHVNDQYEQAREHMPESFFQVTMLYVPIEINGITANAFVDSGAQMTIMSKKFAEDCGLLKHVDHRFQGIAHGVGSSRILGRIHLAQLKIGKNFLPASFTIIEDPKMEFLLGLDLLRRYRMSIDLNKHALLVEGEEIPFLSDGEVTRLGLGIATDAPEGPPPVR